MFRSIHERGRELSLLVKMVEDSVERNALLNFELLYEREKLSRRQAEMSTRAVVLTALGGAVFTFMLGRPIGELVWGELRAVVAISLAFSLLSLLRFEWRAASLEKMKSSLDFKVNVSNLHAHNLKLTSDLVSQQRSANLRELFLLISLVLLGFGLIQICLSGIGID
jgi:hypothetical protein